MKKIKQAQKINDAEALDALKNLLVDVMNEERGYPK